MIGLTSENNEKKKIRSDGSFVVLRESGGAGRRNPLALLNRLDKNDCMAALNGTRRDIFYIGGLDAGNFLQPQIFSAVKQHFAKFRYCEAVIP